MEVDISNPVKTVQANGAVLCVLYNYNKEMDLSWITFVLYTKSQSGGIIFYCVWFV